MKFKIYNLIKPTTYFVLIIMLLQSCKKFVQVSVPTSQLTTGSVYINDATAKAAMLGVYIQLIGSADRFASGGAGSVSVLCGMSADELVNYSTLDERAAFYTNSLNPLNTFVKQSLWDQAYKVIYMANSVLEGVHSSAGVSNVTKQTLEGEAKFIRAFCYFYLVNLFGDVPLALTTSYQVNNIASRMNQEAVYKQIVEDVDDAMNLLPDNYSQDNGQRIRPNAKVAASFLARVHLYQGNWEKAVTEAIKVTSDSSMFELTSLDNVFLKNSREAIWQLMPTSTSLNTNEGNVFILTARPSNVALSPSLYTSFEAADMRKSNWINSLVIDQEVFYYPFKYKIGYGTPISEYSMVFRLAEQYLILAEAYAHIGDMPKAIENIDRIRIRAGLSSVASTDPEISSENFLLLVEHERRVEFFSEWGHRWLDLKRTGRSSHVLPDTKNMSWNNNSTLYPIPDAEIKLNANLTQNPGYN